jgi:forkhead box protein J2/3
MSRLTLHSPNNPCIRKKQAQAGQVPIPLHSKWYHAIVVLYPHRDILSFDPNFPMMAGMRFPAIPPMLVDENVELDEHGNVNWRMAWMKEIGHLQQITQEQEKAGVDSDWYRMMLFRVRGALMPPMNPEAVMHGMPPHMQPPQNPGDMQHQQQQQQPPQQ